MRPSVPLCFVTPIREASRSRSRRERQGSVVVAGRPALCWIIRRPCRAGGPPTRTRSRCAVGGAAPKSSPSRRWKPDHPFFGTFRAQSGSGGFYEVEIRSLDGFANSCGCIDHRVNGLGTCKHIEGVLAALRQRSARAFREAAARGSPRIEVFLDRRERGADTDVARERWPTHEHGARLARFVP